MLSCCQVDNELLLRPGMTANIPAGRARRPAALLIPARSAASTRKTAGPFRQKRPNEPSPARDVGVGEGQPGRGAKKGRGQDGAGKDGAGKDGASKTLEDPSQIATPAVLYVTSDGSRSGRATAGPACASASAIAS